jgi:hypothetical protein
MTEGIDLSKAPINQEAEHEHEHHHHHHDNETTDNSSSKSKYIVLLFAMSFCCFGVLSLAAGAVGIYKVSNSYFASNLYGDTIDVTYETVTVVTDTISYYNYYSIDTYDTLSSIYGYSDQNFYAHMCLNDSNSDVGGWAQAFFPLYLGSLQIPSCASGGVEQAPVVAICDGAPPIFIALLNPTNYDVDFTLSIYIDQNCTADDCDCDYTALWAFIIIVMIFIGLGACCSWCILSSIGACLLAFALFLHKATLIPVSENDPLIAN